MANNCDFEMKVRGTVDNVKSFIDAMKWNGECQNNGVGRVFNCDCCSAYECDDDFVAMIEGDCAWSIQTAMTRKAVYGTAVSDIVTLSSSLQLRVEVYSKEPSSRFQEHFVCKDGIVVTNECVFWAEYYIESLKSDKEMFEEFLDDEEVKAAGINRENYLTHVDDNGYIEVGGFKKWEWDIEPVPAELVLKNKEEM